MASVPTVRHQQTYKKKRHYTVGILTIPHSFSTKYGSSHIMKAYADGLEKHGVTVVPVPYNTPHPDLYYSILNGLIIPGGETTFLLKQPELLQTVQRFISLSLRTGEYFPIWGTCFGFELLMSLIGSMNRFEPIVDHQRRSIEWTDEGKRSRMYRWLSKKNADAFEEYARTAQNHEYGISPIRFLRNDHLRRFFRLVATARNDEGETYVAAIEAKKWPIYGVMWHPERQTNGHLFLSFFLSECKKNNHQCPIRLKTLRDTHIPHRCVQYSEHNHRMCYFFSSDF
jgi:gamma-glutamyl hydrolase